MDPLILYGIVGLPILCGLLAVLIAGGRNVRHWSHTLGHGGAAACIWAVTFEVVWAISTPDPGMAVCLAVFGWLTALMFGMMAVQAACRASRQPRPVARGFAVILPVEKDSPKFDSAVGPDPEGPI